MEVHPHDVSRGEGDGSGAEIDDKYDGEEYTAKDQRADTRTTFYESDIDNLNVSERRKDQLRHALRRQEGEDFGENDSYDEATTSDSKRKRRKQQNREEWKRRVISAYAGQLELTPRQKRRSEHWVLDVLSINSFGRYSVEQVALAAINVVAREDGRYIEDEQYFHSLMEDVGITDDDDSPDMNKMRRLRTMVRERIPSKSA